MPLQCGIIGLPNVGKSTLFNALTKSSVPAENYPFCTIEPHIGIVSLPDARLEKLKTIYNPKKVIPSSVEFIDIAGLVKGASQGDGLGNQFLAQIRQTSAILHVVRCFDSKKINHVDGFTDPIRDVETIETELLLSDLDTLEKQKQKLGKVAKSDNKEAKINLSLIDALIKHCSDGNKAQTISIDEKLKDFKKSLCLLTDKPILYIANIEESDISKRGKNPYLDALKDLASKQGNYIISLCVALEQEIANVDNKEKLLFLSEYNLKEPGLNKVIRLSLDLLGLQTFFTCGKKELKSWTILKGITAPQAAGIIHSDFERGFIKAEVFHYNEIIKYGNEKALRDLGLIRQEGKNYHIKDGDCIFFKFNV